MTEPAFEYFLSSEGLREALDGYGADGVTRLVQAGYPKTAIIRALDELLAGINVGTPE